ncbi:MAG: VanW family protein [Planococcus sp. (in: firmicutes)]|uniref:VanW family protein n=1 Tax=Planococcus halocryophilus TaxID=1215089 RepID=UPI001F0DDD98|nr:VanW family protein [Planococcus halocryophilus]MCH4825621.1 VanW family protein [Planococcus halocryophilus]
MNNKVFGTTFITIILSALLFFGVANAGVLIIDKWIFPNEQFGDHTYIGTTNVSNMEVASAMAQFEGTSKAWKETSELLVTYQDATANYPLDQAEILLDETAEQAESGVQNNFVFDLDSNVTAKFLTNNFPVVTFSEAEIEKITANLELALESGLEKTHVVISDDALSVDRAIISKVIFPTKSSSEGFRAVVEAIDEIQIAPEETFSFLDFVNELGLVGVSDAELTDIASTLYAAVLKTNFSINERSIGTAMPEKDYLGQEATINQSLGIDLVFTNPNASSVTLNTEVSGTSLTAAISGFPLVYDYVINTGAIEKVEYRLIKQFSAFVSSGVAIDEVGSDGARVEVVRTIVSENEDIKVETVSKDFYPPTNRIEIYPLQKEVDNSSTEESSNESTEGTSEENSEDASSENASSNDATGGSDSTDDQTDSSDKSDSSNTDTNGNATNQNGDKANTETDKDSGTDKPVYDKGGNLVNP